MIRKLHIKTITAITLAGGLLTGIPSYGAENTTSQPNSYLQDSLPTTWVLEQQYFQTTPSDDKWWTGFHDPVLDALIKKAVENNYNVLTAMRRIEMAQQQMRITKAGYYPTLGVSTGWNREMTANTIHGEHSHETTMSYFQLGLTANWEIDVFGRIKAQSKADKANYRASIADYDATLVTLCSNVAKAYFQLRMAQSEIEVAEKNVAIAEKQKKLADIRFETGLRPALDVLQAKMSVEQMKASIVPLKAQVSTSVNTLALLLGEYPDKLIALEEPMPLPATPPPGDVEDPQALLRRRPDIVAAEQQLAATAAQIGIAKKDFLPTISVTASAGTMAHSLNQLFGRNAYHYSVIPTLSWTMFDGMARNARLASARLQMEEQIDTYNLTVMTAVSEVNNAMISWQSISEQIVYQEMLLRDARRQVELQTDRYTQGLNGFSDIAGAQLTVLSYEDALVKLHAQELTALVTLYTALGGGY